MGITEGTVVMIAGAAVAFLGVSCYLAYQIVQHKKNVREMVHVLNEDDAAFADSVEEMVASGELVPA